jgi:methylmalonyl-CoA/ethylmalonyl-CoA epimerase
VFHVKDLKIVGIATPDPDEAVTTFRKNFGFPIVRATENGAARTRSTFLAVGSAEIEMTAPTEGGSPLSSFLAERGAGLHQLVLEVDDLEAALGELKEKGIEAVTKSGTDGRPVVVLSPTQTHGVRITLVGR